LPVQKTLIVGVTRREFATYFLLDVLMVHLSKPVVVTDGSNLFGVELAKGETIHFRNLEFIADHFNYLSLSPEGDDSDVVFTGHHHCMSFSRSPSTRTTQPRVKGEASTFLSLGVATW
jgi:hypothetical protein